MQEELENGTLFPIVPTYCEKKILSIEKRLLKFEAEGCEFENFFRSLEQFIKTGKG